MGMVSVRFRGGVHWTLTISGSRDSGLVEESSELPEYTLSLSKGTGPSAADLKGRSPG